MRAPRGARGSHSGLLAEPAGLVDDDEVHVDVAVADLAIRLAVDQTTLAETGIAVPAVEQVVCRAVAALREVIVGSDDVEHWVDQLQVLVAQVVGTPKDDAVEQAELEVIERLVAVGVHGRGPEVVDQLGGGPIAVGLADDRLDALLKRRCGQGAFADLVVFFDGVDLGDDRRVNAREGFGDVGVRVGCRRGAGPGHGIGHGLSHLRVSLHRIAGLGSVYAHNHYGQAL